MSRAGLWMFPDGASVEKPNGKQNNCTPSSLMIGSGNLNQMCPHYQRDDSQREGAAKKREQSDHYYVFT